MAQIDESKNAYIQQLQGAWRDAKASGNTAMMAESKKRADAERARLGYTANADGTVFTPIDAKATNPVTGMSQRQASNLKAPDISNYGKSMYDSQSAYLQQMYNTSYNNLTNNYDTNMTNYDNQKVSLENNYQGQLKDIRQNTYNELERGKALGSMRGTLGSAVGRAQDQSMIRSGNSDLNDATTKRNELLNEISSKINDLTKAYGNDTATLQMNLDQGKLKAMSDSQLAQLNADINMYQFDKNWENQFTMQDRGFEHDDLSREDQQAYDTMSREDQQAFQTLMQDRTFAQEVKMFGLQEALTRWTVSTQEAGANARSASGNSLGWASLNWEKEKYNKDYDKLTAEEAKQKKLNLLSANPNYNPDAKLGILDLLPGKSANQKAYDLNLQALKLQGYSDKQIKQFAKDAYMSWGYDTFNGAHLGDAAGLLNRILGLE